jgi:hypothetical protein
LKYEEEERRILALAAQAGLSSMCDASRISYASWRSRVLRFAQLLQEKENNERTIQKSSGA